VELKQHEAEIQILTKQTLLADSYTFGVSYPLCQPADLSCPDVEDKTPDQCSFNSLGG